MHTHGYRTAPVYSVAVPRVLGARPLFRFLPSTRVQVDHLFIKLFFDSRLSFNSASVPQQLFLPPVNHIIPTRCASPSSPLALSPPSSRPRPPRPRRRPRSSATTRPSRRNRPPSPPA